MRVRSVMLVAGLLVAAPALAQTAAQKAQNATNWDVFLKLYPQRALKAHEEGAVGFTVTLNNKGDITNCQVTRSSGHPLLDAETCNLITLNAVFTPDPNLSSSQTKTHEGVINWKLPNSTTTLSAPTVVASNAAPEQVVCKKVLRTGSLASYERTCMTPSQWAKQSDAMKAEWQDLQGKKGSTAGQ